MTAELCAISPLESVNSKDRMPHWYRLGSDGDVQRRNEPGKSMHHQLSGLSNEWHKQVIDTLPVDDRQIA